MVARTKKSIPVVSPNSLVTARKRKAYFGEWRNVEVYVAEKLQPGDFIEGPAIVEAETTTVILNVGDQLTVDERGWLDIKVATATRAQPELALSA
jgi:N-methylhydantoinase A